MATKINNEYTEFLDSILYYKGRGANNGVWESWVDKFKMSYEIPFIDLNKPLFWKTYGQVRILYYINEYPDLFTGNEFHIEIYTDSEWHDVFRGWVDSLDELKIIIKCVGIPLNIKE